jgi:hypothetical protein
MNDGSLLMLLLFHEKFTSSEKLLRFISEQFSEKKSAQISSLQAWGFLAPYDVEDSLISKILSSASTSKVAFVWK